MGWNVFEVGIFRMDTATQGRSMLLRTWNVESLKQSIGWLRYQNFDNKNIYIRPAGEHNLNLIDDLKRESIVAMKGQGFQPAAIVETSPGNFQAWLKHPEVLSKEVSILAARTLAVKFGGDLGAADWRHFGRLAGLTNRKPRHQNVVTGLFPFVRLIEASGKAYDAGTQFVGEVKQAYEKQQPEMAARRERFKNYTAVRAELKGISAFRNDPRYQGDGNRIDLAYSIYALSNGLAVDEVREVLRSRELSHKGDERRQEAYVERTLRKAMEARDRGCMRTPDCPLGNGR